MGRVHPWLPICARIRWCALPLALCLGVMMSVLVGCGDGKQRKNGSPAARPALPIPTRDAAWVRYFGGLGGDTGGPVRNQSVAHFDDGGCVLGVTERDAVRLLEGKAIAPAADQGSADALLIFLGPDGELQRTRYLGGPGSEKLVGMLGVGGSELIIAGQFEETSRLGDTVLTSVGGADLFLARLDREGRVLRAAGWGGPGGDNLYGVVHGEGARLVVACAAMGARELPRRGGPPITVGRSAGPKDWVLYLAGFESVDSVVWATELPGDVPIFMAPGAGGSVLVAVMYSRAVKFDTGMRLAAPKSSSTYIAEYRAGVLLRVLAFEAALPITHRLDDMACFPDGSLLICGDSTGPVTLRGSATGILPLPKDAPWGAGYVARVRFSGETVWTRSFSDGKEDEEGGAHVVLSRCQVRADGRSLIAGRFHGHAHLGGTPLPNRGDGDAFVALLDPSGATQWTATMGSVERDWSVSLSTARDGAVVLSGESSARTLHVGGRRLKAALQDGRGPEQAWGVFVWRSGLTPR